MEKLSKEPALHEHPELTREERPAQRSLPVAFQLAHWAIKTGPLLILALLVLAMFIATPTFLTISNLGDLGTQAAVVAILGIGQFFVIITRGIDLSVGSILSLATVLCALLFAQTQSGALSVLMMLFVGSGVGLVNGLVLVKWKIPHPFIVTLGMLNVASGAALLLSGGNAIIGVPGGVTTLGSGYLGDIPVAVLFTAALALLAYLFTSHVQLGRWLFAVGGNPEAARRAGIPVDTVLIIVFALSGLFAALGGVVTAGRTDSGYPTAGLGLELDAIAAVIIGGASFFGGRGSIGNVIVGALILGIVRNGLNLLGISSFWQQVVVGCIVVFAVGLDVVRTRMEKKFALLEAKLA